MPRVLSDKTTHITVGIVSRRSQTLNILLRDPVIQLHHASHTVHASDLKKKPKHSSVKETQRPEEVENISPKGGFSQLQSSK